MYMCVCVCVFFSLGGSCSGYFLWLLVVIFDDFFVFFFALGGFCGGYFLWWLLLVVGLVVGMAVAWWWLLWLWWWLLASSVVGLLRCE